MHLGESLLFNYNKNSHVLALVVNSPTPSTHWVLAVEMAEGRAEVEVVLIEMEDWVGEVEAMVTGVVALVGMGSRVPKWPEQTPFSSSCQQVCPSAM